MKRAGPVGCGILGLCLLIATIAGCSNTDRGQPNRMDAVLIPEGAIVTDSFRLSRSTNWTPINRRLVVVHVDRRPYLLVLKQPCPGIMQDPIVLERLTGDKFDAGFASITVRGSPCRVESMYVIQRGDVDWLRENLSSKKY